jgi:hypothetical protein
MRFKLNSYIHILYTYTFIQTLKKKKKKFINIILLNLVCGTPLLIITELSKKVFFC